MSNVPPPGPLRPSPLVEQATSHLRARITEGHWPVGTKLPGETALARELGVGRSTVREAVRTLATLGLLRSRQGAGVFVVADHVTEDWPVRLRRASVTDVYEVRMLIEVQAARLAARRRTDEDLAALDAALTARLAAGAGIDDADFVDADIAVHRAVVAAAHNPVLTDLFAEFAPALRQALIDLVDLLGLRREDPRHGHAGHHTLVTAIVAGDPDRAARAAQEELEATLSRLRGE
ncbi:FadR/GntR family transcriptional regulator [Streptomyces sp. NBC_00726]|uniref:FadR/GntR family transcriptional regulator n=1 Tax=Streptomyces sp. NBC_00726 TaxID=2903674 RepID=UPI0038681851